MSRLKLWVVILVRMISWLEDNPLWGRNALKHLRHEHHNLEGIRGTINESLKMNSAISYPANYVPWQWLEGKLDLQARLYKDSHCPRQWEEQSSSSNPQSVITSEEHLEILLRILSTKNFNITSLLHLREYSLYAFVQVDTVSLHTQTGCQNYWRSNTILQCSAFHPHLLSNFILRGYYRYSIWHLQVHHYRVVTLRRILRRATLDGRGVYVSSY